ncbi:MAG TPA: hypothetical protein VMZ28_00240 [Kofleriaceae bacterium]|nr:hypothetical protein [Kofleriaceae bacterium]
MLRYHMLVVTPDTGLKRSIKRLTTATGATADFVTDSTQSASRGVDLAIFDARQEMPDRRFLGQLPRSARIIYIVRGDDLIRYVGLFEDTRATSLFCHDERFDDDEFISSATKALRGELFGLQKYFPWGVTTFSMLVKSYQEKVRAIDIMMNYAQAAGVRGPVRDRIQLVADELMMNALYHAPVDASGQELYRGYTLKQLATLPDVSPVQVQYGCSGRYFGIAVRDAGGSLQRDRALSYLVRAQTGATMETKASGAGLGLVSVLRSVSKLVFNLAPGYSTEVIALFDMDLFAHGKVGARSLHVFTANVSGLSNEPDEEELAVGDATKTRANIAPAPPRSHGAGWVLAGFLGAVLASLGTAYYFVRTSRAASAQADAPPAPTVVEPETPSLTVLAEPSSADVLINGAEVESGLPWRLPARAERVEISVTADGHRAWSRTMKASELTGRERIFVRLDRAP